MDSLGYDSLENETPKMYDYVQNLISDQLKKMVNTQDEIIKESLSEYHHLPLNEETYKRVTKILSEDEPQATYYFLDSEELENFKDADWSKYVCKFVVPLPWEMSWPKMDLHDDKYMYKTKFYFHTPYKNSKFNK